METTPQNWNQYFLQHQTPMNIAINTQSEHPYNQFYGFPNLFYHPIIPQQMIYHPSSFIPPESTQLIEQLLLETIPDLDGTEGSFEMKKFFKKFDITLQDWSEKKKIFALKSKLYGKAKSFFILAIKSRHYNYKSIKNFILCQLLPSEYKVEESIDLVKKQTNSTQQKKNLKGHEKCHKQQNIPTPSFKNKVNIRFEKEEFPKEILEFFEKPIDQDSAKDESEFENFEKKGKLNNQFQKSSLNKINVPFENVSYPSEVLEFFGCPKEKEPSIVEKEIKLVDELQNSVPTDLHKKEIKKDIKEKNLLVEFEKEADFDLPINLFEEKAENKFKEESDISEKDLDIGLLEDSGNEQFCELDLELNFSLDGKQDFVSVEVLIPTEIHVFQEIVPLDIPVEIVSSESEKCFDLEKVGEASVELNEFGKEECDLKERGGDLCVDLKEFEKESEEYFDLKEMDDYCYGLEVEENDDKQESLGPKLEVFESDPEKEILPTRDKLKILEENENVKEKRKLLRSKLKEARILARLRCEVLMKENKNHGTIFSRSSEVFEL
ncbi:unnamed protein product [Meloidogyne enterolobii]|uniref:Uncharacterized protein n=1 Tax=Meloidogyne enterolobii TaxID=390850 RepID=A0ACB1A5Q2_MELEN